LIAENGVPITTRMEARWCHRLPAIRSDRPMFLVVDGEGDVAIPLRTANVVNPVSRTGSDGERFRKVLLSDRLSRARVGIDDHEIVASDDADVPTVLDPVGDLADRSDIVDGVDGALPWVLTAAVSVTAR